ncbi:MAG: YdcH family protein [bacterium]
MSVEHHDLIHELPEYKQKIHDLKLSDSAFRTLFDEYHELTRDIENMENEVSPSSTEVEEKAKLRRVQLKDQLHSMLKSAGQ